jgi:hypothetical protein
MKGESEAVKIYNMSDWQYKQITGKDYMECQSCDDEIGEGYLIVEIKDRRKLTLPPLWLTDEELDKIYKQVDTDTGQQCGSCLAMFLCSTNYTVNRV